MKTLHKHAELIKAWADGAEIEVEHISYGWVNAPSPRWLDHAVYRIKSEPKPDVVEQYVAKKDSKYGCVRIAEHWEKENLKLTFDGETGKLKAAEVLK